MGSSWSRKKTVQRTVDIETEKKRVTTNERGSQYNVTAGGNVYFLGNSPNFSTSPELKKRPCPLEEQYSTDSPEQKVRFKLLYKRRRYEASEERESGAVPDWRRNPRTMQNFDVLGIGLPTIPSHTGLLLEETNCPETKYMTKVNVGGLETVSHC
ncbi:hypothetical protein GCK72_006850 [Caenorhabditis remanei]|uniref:Uncharacterized protein n=1 Tax=Caenorhabditis remanei TaxID=31234 RepID=A0A6A5HM17_CAERE|nr:hypothetical protein GCK72_006850 [Caenorhabditis remanei]KAF1766892.1 hypothetical protein GCK72_006850 [Caenorhabditis remanei]